MSGTLSAARRLDDIKPSGIRVLFDRAAELEAAGERIIHFEIGRPDFDTPGHIKAAAQEALDAGKVHYSSNWGIPEFRRAIAGKFRRDSGLTYATNDEILVTIGANEAVFLAMLATLDPGDEVIVPTPTWPHYAECVRLAGAVPIHLPLDPGDDYALHAEAVAGVLTARTRMVVVCSPNNPTGAVVSREELDALGGLLTDTPVVVLADDIYEYLVYDGIRHVCPASVPSLRDRTLVVGGLAKAYAMDGWRLGWLAGPRELIRSALRVRQYTTVCAPTFLQSGAVAALDGTQNPREAMCAEFARRRTAALDVLAGESTVSLAGAQGAFYLYLRYDSRLPVAQELCRELLEERHVAVVPGEAFEPGEEHSVRIAYSCPIEDVREGLTRILEHLRSRLAGLTTAADAKGAVANG